MIAEAVNEVAGWFCDAWEDARDAIREWRCRRACEYCRAGDKAERRISNSVEYVHTIYGKIPSALPGKTAMSVLHTMCGANELRIKWEK